MRGLLLGATLFLLPSVAEANIGIPTLVLFWPGMIVLLPLVILVEAVTARRVLATGWGPALKLSGWANAVSTLAGIPLAWCLLMLLVLVAGPLAAWLLPEEVAAIFLAPLLVVWLPPEPGGHEWLVPLAVAGLCLPMFFVSVWVERQVGRRVRKGEGPEGLRQWAWQANLLSYAGIATALLLVALSAVVLG